MEDDKKMDQQQEGQQDAQQDGMRVFTQEQLDKIIKERLAKEKAKSAADLAAKVKELEARELELDARSLLTSRQIPQELLPALNLSSKEAMENSVNLLAEWMLRGKPPTFSGRSWEPPEKKEGIRQAMGL